MRSPERRRTLRQSSSYAPLLCMSSTKSRTSHLFLHGGSKPRKRLSTHIFLFLREARRRHRSTIQERWCKSDAARVVDTGGSGGNGDSGGSGDAEKRRNDSERNTPAAAVLDGGSTGNSDGGSVAGQNTPAAAVLDGGSVVGRRRRWKQQPRWHGKRGTAQTATAQTATAHSAAVTAQMADDRRRWKRGRRWQIRATSQEQRRQRARQQKRTPELQRRRATATSTTNDPRKTLFSNFDGSDTIDKAYFVDLFVRASNTPAIKMYEKLGYVIYRRVLKYYSGEEDGLDMRKALSRDVEKKSIIPLKRPVTPDELEYD
ncbi:N-alpha-acetyltransferase 20 [Nymphaea thermarum]|nr:N-alpha-acetyltransferase 20 [Nymphaea thermarum]